VAFYVKGMDAARDKISRNRLEKPGDFNIEIPIQSLHLQSGPNRLLIETVDGDDVRQQATVAFSWNPDPISLPLDLGDLSGVDSVQEIGQVVDGAFEVDAKRNVIRGVAPVERDALLLLGSPHTSQEATYAVRFAEGDAIFLGLSDFFAGHEDARPPIGIRPGWSSAGLATLRTDPNKCAQIWLAWGDLLDSPQKWVVKTDPPRPFDLKRGIVYRVRHQVRFAGGVNMSRLRIWPEGSPEPSAWLCAESDAAIGTDKTKRRAGSFGLFQFHGAPTEWSDIVVRALE
jgi:hypothetical protein